MGTGRDNYYARFPLKSRLIAWHHRAALALLVAGGPVLVFPDLLPGTWRSTIGTLLTLAALGLGLALLHQWPKVRWGLWLFLCAVVASWVVMPVHDRLAIRHFAGIGVGVLAMAVVATWCTTINRLITATLLFALASIGVLSVGLLGTYLTRTKLLIDATQAIRIPPEISQGYLYPAFIYPWLPHFKLGLPGLEGSDGWVNSNALGGTALMLLPTCCGLAAAALVGCRRRKLMLAVGTVATTVAVAVLGMARSRTALIAAGLVLVVLAFRWRRGRPWLFLAVFLSSIGLAFSANQSRLAAPDNFAYGVELLRINIFSRGVIWREAVERLMEAPLLGIGINQFHDTKRPVSVGGPTRVAHAHNTFLQVALDAGLLGLAGYCLLLGTLLITADHVARGSDVVGRIAGGAGLSLLGIHFFGLGDAIALGAKVGLFQWLCAGLILAASGLAQVWPDQRGHGRPRVDAPA